MANNNDNNPNGGPAVSNNLNLSQAILAPLNSIFKAQIHAARSFLNMLLQIGFPHIALDQNGKPIGNNDKTADSKFLPYTTEFQFEVPDKDNNPKKYSISIPNLALVPLAPLTIETAEFNFALKVTSINDFRQIQSSETSAINQEAKTGREKSDYHRDWFLVDHPMNFEGVISSKSSDTNGNKQNEAQIDINIKLSKASVPAALDKLLTALSQSIISQEIK